MSSGVNPGVNYGEPLRIHGMGLLEGAHAIAAELNDLNPKLPIELQLTSWDPIREGPGIGTIDGEKAVYVDIVCASPSRILHFHDRLAEFAEERRRLRRHIETQTAPEPVVSTPDERELDQAMAWSMFE